jgi:DNA-binding PadR family transcriptional regulator
VSERPLLPGEHAILGLLAIRPMHGYEMARYFDRDDLTEVCPIEPSLLYTYFRNLEQRGLVRGRESRVGRRPPRRVFELTVEGRTLLDGWLYRPVERMRETRLELLLKLYVLHHLDPQGERRLLGDQLAVCHAYEARLTERVAEASGFKLLVAGSKLSAARATLAWLESYVGETASQPAPTSE